MGSQPAQLQAWACLLIVAIALSSSCAAVDGKKFKKLEFYLHEQFVSVPGYEATDVLIASPSGNTSVYAFGNFGVTEQVIREGMSNTSRIIGRAPGTFQPNKEHESFALYKLLTLQTQEWNGTIVVFSDWLTAAASNEWAVVGGTGTFRMVRGYAENFPVDADRTSFYAIFKWDLYLLYP